MHNVNDFRVIYNTFGKLCTIMPSLNTTHNVEFLDFTINGDIRHWWIVDKNGTALCDLRNKTENQILLAALKYSAIMIPAELKSSKYGL